MDADRARLDEDADILLGGPSRSVWGAIGVYSVWAMEGSPAGPSASDGAVNFGANPEAVITFQPPPAVRAA
jgi:hypothetical protein